MTAPQTPPPRGVGARKKRFLIAGGLALIALYLMAVLVGAGYVLLSLWPSAPPSSSPTPAAINVTLWPFSPFEVSEEVRVIGLVLVAGAIGSAAYGLYAEFVHVARRDFRFRWTLWYVARPFIGAFFGLIFYLALRAGLFSTGAPLSELNVFGFTALAALVGMFSEETLAKFKLIAESFLTKAEFFTEDFDTGEGAPADGTYVFVEHSEGVTCAIDHTGQTIDMKKGDPLPAAPQCGKKAIWMRLPPAGR